MGGKRIFLLIMMFANCIYVFSQQHYENYDKFTIQDGLPSNNVTSVYKDSKGYLWVGTASGLAKYDGYKFHEFKAKDDELSLKGNVIKCISEDSEGYIWIGTSNLARYDRKLNRWKNFYFHEKGKTNTSNDFIFDIKQENDSILWFTTINGLTRFNKQKETHNFFIFPENIRYDCIEIVEIIDNKHLIIHNSGWGLQYFDIEQMAYSNIDTKVAVKNIQYYFKNHIIYYNIKSNDYYSYPIDLGTKRKICDRSNMNTLFFPSKNNLCVVKGSSLQLFDANLNEIDSIFFGDLNPSHFSAFFLEASFIDNNVLWLATNNGLYKISLASTFKSLTKKDGLRNDYIRCIKLDGADLFYGTRLEQTFLIKNISQAISTKTTNPIWIGLKNRKITTNKILKVPKSNQFLFIASHGLFLYDKGQNLILDVFRYQYPSGNYNNQAWSAYALGNRFLIGTIMKPSIYVVKIKDNKIILEKSFPTINSSNTIVSMHKDLQGNIWLGGEGLFKLHIDSADNFTFEEFFPFEDTVLHKKNPVWNIIDYDDNNLLLGTTENGIFLLNKFSKKFIHFTTKNGLSDNCISTLIKDNNGNIWIGTKNGLDMYNPFNNHLYHYTKTNGLVSNDFNFKSVEKSKDGWLFFGTKEGLVYFHPDSIENKKVAHNLFLNEFKVLNGKTYYEIADGDKIVLSHSHNTFDISYSMLDFLYSKDIKYKYKLKNYEDNFRTTTGKNPTASYALVPPGEYVFNVQAFNPYDKTIKQEINVPITIVPAYYQTKAFKWGLILLVISIVGFIVFLLFKRQVYKSKLFKTELDLLRSQMNPHFIFNIMTGIQSIVLKNDKIAAVNYLSKFARLMRMSLNFSREEHTSIENSLGFLDTYIHLESLNLNEPIAFEKYIDPNIDKQNTFVPSLILQPFIENSIIHGLAPKDKDMHLKLVLEKYNTYILCIIEDNGVGREKAIMNKKQKDLTHKSVGIEITSKRIKMQALEANSKKDNITIEDLYNKNNEPIGTKIFLKIPYIYKNKA